MSGNGRRPESTGVESRLSIDTVFEILGDHRRRELLRVLEERSDERFEVPEVVSRLGEDGDRPRGDGRARSVETELRHVHIPKLRSAGLVADADDEGLRYRSDERVSRWLSYVRAETDGATAQ